MGQRSTSWGAGNCLTKLATGEGRLPQRIQQLSTDRLPGHTKVIKYDSVMLVNTSGGKKEENKVVLLLRQQP